jgi:hypothetical protein
MPVMSFNSRFNYPPAIARTLGFDLVDSGNRSATIEIVTDTAKHASPMGTISRYVCDILNGGGKLVAQATSTVMTLRGEKASGR